MLIIDISEHFLLNDDNIYFVTGVTGITGPSLITHDIISDLPESFGHAMDEAATGSKRKHSVDALSHLQYFMDASKHKPIKWEGLTRYHMYQKFWGSFSTYLGKYARDKTKVKFANVNPSASKKSVGSLK